MAINFDTFQFYPHPRPFWLSVLAPPSFLKRETVLRVLRLRRLLPFCPRLCRSTSYDVALVLCSRLATPQWRVKEIDPLEARRSGRCPLSPAEVGLTLRALGFARDTVMYVASGELFGGPDALAPLREHFPNLVTKVRPLAV